MKKIRLIILDGDELFVGKLKEYFNADERFEPPQRL